MPLFDPIIPMRYVAAIIEFIRECDRTKLTAILKLAGLEKRVFDDTAETLTFSQVDRLLTAAAGELQREDIGFELGLRVGIDSHGSLTQVLRDAPTTDALLRIAENYFRLITPAFSVRYLRGAVRSEYVVSVATGMSAGTLRQFIELFAVSLYRDLTQLLGRSADLRVYLSISAPSHLSRYQALDGARFHFAAEALPTVRFIMTTALLDKPLPRRSEGMTVDVGTLRDAMHAIKPTRRIADWIRMMLNEAEGIQPGLADFANLLNVCPRTLTRMLGAEGVNLRVLSREIRHRRAIEMLCSSAQPVSEIGYRLGYGSAAAFVTAFRKMAGVTPMAFRKRPL